MEDECGNTEHSLRILHTGLGINSFNEALLTRYIKQLERLHDLNSARQQLAKLKHYPIKDVWKAVFEGALFEARAGKIDVARQFLKYLMDNVSWYGPIYFEAYKLEEKIDRSAVAMDIIQRGLKNLPRYGPLWFGLLRMVERRDVLDEMRKWLQGCSPCLRRLRAESSNAITSISRELIWKVHFELSQAEERAAESASFGMCNTSTKSLNRSRNELLANARMALLRSLMTAPPNLRWKVLLAASRLELSTGSLKRARRLLCKAFTEVPPKSRSNIYLECSRVEEFAGNVDAARRILIRACREVHTEWKVFLEAVLLEARTGNLRRAVRTAETALRFHAGTGRLWAILVQLCHRLEGMALAPTPGRRRAQSSSAAGAGDDVTAAAALVTASVTAPSARIRRLPTLAIDATVSTSASASAASAAENSLGGESDDGEFLCVPIQSKEDVLRRALLEVPKSGEVWCEGARCHLNPLLLRSFDLGLAQLHLNFAIQFTPQYGDTFIEYLRLELLCQVLLPRVLAHMGLPFVPFVRRFLCNDREADSVVMLEDYPRLQAVCETPFPERASPSQRSSRRSSLVKIEKMQLDLSGIFEAFKVIGKKNLERRCMNADPNYGTAWFFCRSSPIDAPTSILSSAQEMLMHELYSAQPIYIRALCHYVKKCIAKHDRISPSEVTPSRRPSSAPQRRSTSASPPKVPPSTTSSTTALAAQSSGDHAQKGITGQDLQDTSAAIDSGSKPSSPRIISRVAANGISSDNGTKLSHRQLSSSADGLNLSAMANLDINSPRFAGSASSSSIVEPIGADGARTPSRGLSSTASAASRTPHSAPSSASKLLKQSKQPTTEGDNDFRVLLESQEDGRDQSSREQELWEDLRIVRKELQDSRWPSEEAMKSISIADIRGTVYVSSDFVTALIGLNRLVFNRKLSAEDRRRVLFGSDQILP